jgi:hypothetical protein
MGIVGQPIVCFLAWGERQRGATNGSLELLVDEWKALSTTMGRLTRFPPCLNGHGGFNLKSRAKRCLVYATNIASC